MSIRAVVVDTNVVVSGLITGREGTPVCSILDAMLRGDLRFLLCTELLAEYREVLLRPRIRRLHGLAPSEIDVILEQLTINAIWREAPPPTTPAPDPGDNHLWSLLGIEKGAILVTGDRLLLEQPPPDRSVISPRGFVELSDKQGGKKIVSML